MYYYTISKIDKDNKNEEIMLEIINIFYTHKERYGYRRIHLELLNKGFKVSHGKVKCLMSRMGLYALNPTPKQRYNSYRGDMNGTCKNLLHDKSENSFTQRHISTNPNLSQTYRLIFHSDQGWQYQHFLYHGILKDKGIIQSISRKGNCWDNSPMENFFGKMKNGIFYGFEDTFKSLLDLKKATID